MSDESSSSNRKLVVAVVLFPGFDLLSMALPLELLIASARFRVKLVNMGGSVGVPSSILDQAEQLADEPVAVIASLGGDRPGTVELKGEGIAYPDVVLMPGMGVKAFSFSPGQESLVWLRVACNKAKIVLSVCTGAALLASCGLLNGIRATTSNRGFSWVAKAFPRTEWVLQPRWVRHRKWWTASGVGSSGCAALSVVAELVGVGVARDVARRLEYSWNEDGEDNPHAAERHRLVVLGSSVAAGKKAKKNSGWVSRLSTDFPLLEVVNQSKTGLNTAEAVSNFDILVRPPVRAVVISLSLSNEGVGRGEPEEDGKAAAVFVAGVRELCARAKGMARAVILCSPYPNSNFTDDQKRLSNNVIESLRQIKGVYFADFWGDGAWAEGESVDAGHPNAQGHARMYTTMLRCVAEAIRQDKALFSSAYT